MWLQKAEMMLHKLIVLLDRLTCKHEFVHRVTGETKHLQCLFCGKTTAGWYVPPRRLVHTHRGDARC